MIHLLDWYSFTLPTKQDANGRPVWLDPANPRLVHRQALALLYQKLGKQAYESICSQLPQDIGKGRFPYENSVADAATGTRIFFDPAQPHILCEVPGRGCASIDADNLVTDFASNLSARCTRIDLSADIRTDISPFEFAAAGHKKRFASTSTHTSTRGETMYIGSPKSDRRAAIYRYNPPHPRNEFLRIEHRFRRDQAKRMAAYLAETSLPWAVSASGQEWGWEHELWEPGEIETRPEPISRFQNEHADQELWLRQQVIPALRRYERDGVVDDLRAWLEENLFDDHSSDLE